MVIVPLKKFCLYIMQCIFYNCISAIIFSSSPFTLKCIFVVFLYCIYGFEKYGYSRILALVIEIFTQCLVVSKRKENSKKEDIDIYIPLLNK